MKNSQDQDVAVDEQGYLLDFAEWDRKVAESMAKDLGIVLADKHWQVVDFIQNQHKAGVEMTVRSMGQSGVVEVAELYTLFPGGPLKYAYKIAGLPRPKNCV